MKYFLLLTILCVSLATHAQKYILLDEAIAQPAVYTNHLTDLEKYKKFSPVEVKELPQFLEVLQKIDDLLNGKNNNTAAINFKAGCADFKGRAFKLASGTRFDYILTADCEGFKKMMHLCDAKLTNANNAYFIRTWIKYIKSNMKRK
jgi:hypothetical protein